VVFPTETVYGLGADAGNDEACRAVFARKERPADNPLIVHVSELDQVAEVAREVSAAALALFQRFTPGPLSIILPAGPFPAGAVTAGHSTVAVRIPAHPVAQAFLRACDAPVAAPSANRSGRPSPTSAGMAYRDLAGRVDLILDGGPCGHGLESTVVSIASDQAHEAVAGGVTILREGAVTREMIRELLGPEVTVRGGRPDLPGASPGTRHAHYQPAAQVELFEMPGNTADPQEGGSSHATTAVLERRIGELPLTARTTLVLYSAAAREMIARRGGGEHALWRVVEISDPEDYGRRLYSILVSADERGDERVLAELPPPMGIGRAVRDRLSRAAGRDTGS